MALRFEIAYATLAWPSAHFALSLALQSKSRAKCSALAKRRQPLVVRRHKLEITSKQTIIDELQSFLFIICKCIIA
ncbi:hypothetical protein EHQ32_10365 [Leptospira wolffii]|nr:hypothetical protein EHQ32_10365 [Leptospira wolffii]